MSADEIRRLAGQAFDDGIPSPSHRAGLLYIEYRCKQYATALFNYAAMVERCEEIKVEYPFDAVINTANYILKGAKK